ncbi:MAG: DegV family protein [Firmicutes bacterium]|nr:DegV family protein [Bacillota bacterium]
MLPLTVKIITDSTADLPLGLADQLGITVVPLKVHFGDDEYLDWIDLGPDAFYTKLAERKVLPRTSQPAPADFEAVYKMAAAEQKSIISIHLSAELSGTYQSAVLARNSLPEFDITVVDSRLASMAFGIVVLEAARAARAGRSKEEILAQINRQLARVRVYFAVGTLEFLQRNGRIGKAAAWVGGLLNVKPLLTLKDGIVVPKEKVRGKAKAMERLLELVQEEADGPVGGKAVVLHGNEPERAGELTEKLQQRYNFSEVIVSSIGAVIGTHAGPGVLAVCVLQEDV